MLKLLKISLISLEAIRELGRNKRKCKLMVKFRNQLTYCKHMENTINLTNIINKCKKAEVGVLIKVI